jgi:hypothetical protein
MPASTARRPPLDAARRRLAFDALLRDRLAADREPPPPADHAEALVDARDASDDGELLAGTAHVFADAVDAENVRRQQAAGPQPPQLDYDDAVVIVGDAGTVVVAVDEYDTERTYHEVCAGNVERAIAGPALMRYLRTGDARR